MPDFAQPTGTVTFLFTDIEGSTQLWEQYPDTMRLVLARHDQILRDSIEGSGGYIFKTVGDAFCAAFPAAPQALEAALAAQVVLAAEPWELPAPLAVRMALHTGAAEEWDGDYFGQPINRVARLIAAGHGGQILLSDVTQGLVQDALPLHVSLLNLGERRLKDLGRPGQVFQLQHTALPADFPPLRTLDNPALPNNLPQQATSFIGREREAAEVKDLLAKTRLLTLAGTGGGGKSRLSLQVAADLLDRYFDGVWLVELAALSDPALVPQAVADVLGVQEQPEKPLQLTLAEWLRTRRLLIVLDNCEHLVAACAALTANLLRSCPHVRILATSREPLNVPGERVYRVPSLSLPDPRQAQTAETVSQYEAAALFIERAQAVQPSFAVTNANAPAVALVCRRLDGIPLAIELAAARVRSLSVEEVHARLDNRFRLLTGGARTLLPRQQTLRALIDWSYDLLTEQEKAVLERLSVFAGGWTLAAAEAVCAGSPAGGVVIKDWEVLDLMTGLVDKSLVIAGTRESGTRYRLLETVRQYALDRLTESGEAGAIQEKAAAWFLDLAETAEPELRGPDQEAWMTSLEAEHDNLRAGLSWYVGTAKQAREAGGTRSGLRLAGALLWFWFVRGYYSEGRYWLGSALSAAREPAEEAQVETLAARSKALKAAGVLAVNHGDDAEAQALLREGLMIARHLGDRSGIVSLLGFLGNNLLFNSDYAEARAMEEESLAVAREIGDRNGIAYALILLGYIDGFEGNAVSARRSIGEGYALVRQVGDQQGMIHSRHILGMIALGQGEAAEARTHFEEGLTLSRRVEDRQGIALCLGGLGQLAAEMGRYAEAQAFCSESLAVARGLGDRRAAAEALLGLGAAAFGQGASAEARAFYGESLTAFRRIEGKHSIAECLERMAAACVQGELSRAARLFGASAALRESIGSPQPPARRAKLEDAAASVRAALGGAAFSAAWDVGQAMSWERAAEYALSAEQ